MLLCALVDVLSVAAWAVLAGWYPSDEDVTAIFAASHRPTSLTENVYNHRGQVTEVRSWYSTGSTAAYRSTLTYYDHADRTLETRSPGSGIQKRRYDGKGRQVLSHTLAGDPAVELTKTQTVYNSLDQAIQSIRWERRHDATGSELDAGNSVQSWTYSWYDDAGKLSTTADYGTTAGDDTYTTGSGPGAYDPENPPEIGAAGVLVSKYGYDAAGNQTEVYHPDGTLTRSIYDGLNRLVETIEDDNYEGHTTGLRRRTGYVTQIGLMLLGSTSDEDTHSVFV